MFTSIAEGFEKGGAIGSRAGLDGGIQFDEGIEGFRERNEGESGASLILHDRQSNSFGNIRKPKKLN
jgi:hypothetical protein